MTKRPPKTVEQIGMPEFWNFGNALQVNNMAYTRV